MRDHVYVNLLLASVTVPGPDGRPINVHPWHDRNRFLNDKDVVVVVRGEHFAQYVSERGPLFRPDASFEKLFRTVPECNVRDVGSTPTQRAENTSFVASGPNDPPLAPASGPRDVAPPAPPVAPPAPPPGPAAGDAVVASAGSVATPPPAPPADEPTAEELAAADAALAASTGDGGSSEGGDDGGTTEGTEGEQKPADEKPADEKPKPTPKPSLRDALKGKKK